MERNGRGRAFRTMLLLGLLVVGPALAQEAAPQAAGPQVDLQRAMLNVMIALDQGRTPDAVAELLKVTDQVPVYAPVAVLAREGAKAAEEKRDAAAAAAYEKALRKLQEVRTGNDFETMLEAVLSLQWELLRGAVLADGKGKAKVDVEDDAGVEKVRKAASGAVGLKEYARGAALFLAAAKYHSDGYYKREQLASAARMADAYLLAGAALAEGRLSTEEAVDACRNALVLIGDHEAPARDKRGELMPRLKAVVEQILPLAAVEIPGHRAQAQLYNFFALGMQAAGRAEGYEAYLKAAVKVSDDVRRQETRLAELAAGAGVEYKPSVLSFALAADLHRLYMVVLQKKGQELIARQDFAAHFLVDEYKDVLMDGREAAEGLLELSPESWQGYLLLAEFILAEPTDEYTSEGEVRSRERKAKEAVRKAGEVGKEVAEAQYLVGMGLMQLDRQAAVKPFKRFLELAPKDPRAEEVKKQLDKIAPGWNEEKK